MHDIPLQLVSEHYKQKLYDFPVTTNIALLTPSFISESSNPWEITQLANKINLCTPFTTVFGIILNNESSPGDNNNSIFIYMLRTITSEIYNKYMMPFEASPSVDSTAPIIEWYFLFQMETQLSEVTADKGLSKVIYIHYKTVAQAVAINSNKISFFIQFPSAYF